MICPVNLPVFRSKFRTLIEDVVPFLGKHGLGIAENKMNSSEVSQTCSCLSSDDCFDESARLVGVVGCYCGSLMLKNVGRLRVVDLSRRT